MAKSVFPGANTGVAITVAGAAALVIIAVAVTGCGARFGPNETTTPTTSAAPMVAPERLDSVLVGVADVNTVMGLSDLQPAAPIAHATWVSTMTLSNPDCLGAFLSAQTPVYQGSGSTAASYEYLRTAGIRLCPAGGGGLSLGRSGTGFPEEFGRQMAGLLAKPSTTASMGRTRPGPSQT